jgi:putative phosphoesterase
MERMVEQCPQVTTWIHGGDYCEDADDLALYVDVPVYSVRGNNDFRSYNVPECRTLSVDGVGITVIHGHQWYHNRLQRLAELGKKNHSSLVVFGHTHRRFLEQVEGITVVNPGSISRPRDCRTGTYAICCIENGVLGDVKLVEL